MHHHHHGNLAWRRRIIARSVTGLLWLLTAAAVVGCGWLAWMRLGWWLPAAAGVALAGWVVTVVAGRHRR